MQSHHEGPPQARQEADQPPTLESLARRIEELERGQNAVASLAQYLGPESPLHEDAGLKEVRQHSAAKDRIAKIRQRQQARGRKLLGDSTVIAGLGIEAASAERPNRAAVLALKTLYTGTAVAAGILAGYEGAQAIQTLGQMPQEAKDLLAQMTSPNFSAIDPSKLSPVELTNTFPFVKPHVPDVSGAVNPMWQPYSQAVTKGFDALIASGTNFASEVKAAAVASVGSAIIACVTHPWRPVIRNSSFVGPIAASGLKIVGNAINSSGITDKHIKRLIR